MPTMVCILRPEPTGTADFLIPLNSDDERLLEGNVVLSSGDSSRTRDIPENQSRGFGHLPVRGLIPALDDVP